MNRVATFRFGRAVVGGLLVAALVTGCTARPSAPTGTEIVTAREALTLVAQAGTVLVDARPAMDYRDGHVQGAVNVSRADIVVNTPYPNMLADVEQIERVMSSRGIGNDTLVVVYDDNNNMDSARLWWTLKVYGHHNVKVVSGGLQALRAAGAVEDAAVVQVTPARFTAQPADQSMMISAGEIRAALNADEPGFKLVDTRTIQEVEEHGTIPGSVLIDYRENNFRDGTIRPAQHIRIKYLEAGIDFDDTVVMYCQTSIRGAETFLALYNAGYRNLKLYDGAWVEWSANPMNPVQRMETSVQLRATDAS